VDLFSINIPGTFDFPIKSLSFDAEKMSGNYSKEIGSWSGDWSFIKEVKVTQYNLEIVYKIRDGKPFTLQIGCNEELRPRLAKAIKHMATLKGAKLIDNDLFSN
jgi:hypothetical protein